MTTSPDHVWLVPSELPLDKLKGRDLEECVYWLMDAMGARDLEWRTGGKGGGAADGGRDLATTFHSPAPDGELEAQRWWIECKGRTGTLEKDAVTSAVNNATGQNLDRLIIVTNSDFSNPTRDWVREWQSRHPRPVIALWDKASLERQLTKHPAVAVRLFSEALSPLGRLAAVASRFLNRFELATPKTCEMLWASKDSLTIDPLARISLLASEVAHGALHLRPWTFGLSKHALEQTAGLALANLPALAFRAIDAGVDMSILTRTVAHLIVTALRVNTAREVALWVPYALDAPHDGPPSDEAVEYLLLPVMDQIRDDFERACSSDCQRFYARQRDVELEPAYWAQYAAPAPRPNLPGRKRAVRIEALQKPCTIGFEMSDDVRCPLFQMDVVSLSTLEGFFDIVKAVVERRAPQPMGAVDGVPVE